MLGSMDAARGESAGSVGVRLPAGVGSIEAMAGGRAMSEALKFFARERRWIDEQHLAVCRIAAPTFQEERRAGWMAEQLRGLGWEAQIDRAGNVAAMQAGGWQGTGPVVAVTAHLDTVLAPRTAEEIRVDGRQRFCGPGVADNGAGLAGLLAVGRALGENRGAIEPERLALVANVGEEGEGNLSGMRYLCQQSGLAGRLRSVVVLDGPDTAHITAEALACRRFEVTVNGPGGHSWSDHGAANAVHALARAITWYGDARREEQPRQRPNSWNFGVIEGGTTVNTIPAQARVKVDLRAESASDLEELAASLAATLERALLEENERARSGRVTARLKETGSRPGGRLSENAAILGYVRAVDGYLGIKAGLDCASTDANIPLSMGLAAVSIGAGGQGGGAHTANEWYWPEGRDLGLRRVLLLVGLLAADAAGGG